MTLVAAALASGYGPVEIGERRRVTRETVRGQPKAIFLKTGTRRQAELVTLLSKLSRGPTGGD